MKSIVVLDGSILIAGQRLTILNSDGILHNLRSSTRANEPFSRLMPAPESR